jgi:hypothetical protein
VPASRTPGVAISRLSARASRRISLGLSCGAAMIPSQPHAIDRRTRSRISSSTEQRYPRSRSPSPSTLVSTVIARIFNSEFANPRCPGAAIWDRGKSWARSQRSKMENQGLGSHDSQPFVNSARQRHQLRDIGTQRDSFAVLKSLDLFALTSLHTKFAPCSLDMI